MKRPVSLILIYSLCTIGALSQQSDNPRPGAIVHVATALNHLTVLEFHEPVTMAAAGSPDFQIEREANKVFVKPIKSGAATDLFVWTDSGRFAYELEITLQVKDMNFAIDSSPAAPISTPKPVVETDTDQVADVVLTRALLGAEEIKQRNMRKAKSQVGVRVDHVFRTRSNLYVHYAIENNSILFYPVSTPQAFQLKIDNSSISLSSFAHTQLDRAMLEALGGTLEIALPVASAETEVNNLHPGETTRGVISIRKDLKSPAVVQLVFGNGVKAVFVL